ncbi:MAG: YdcF family protein [Phenylobacterium sp.]|uniref:YdcF family protein n=1 Tax=Phenylobacterium sp. TaxID=1871053 RepID=UPI0017DCC983|nr:YdcF family protein [Phenylobacterium sp.]MBA4793829.1 YdcF family protein [Phenylobacterium sp.]
MSVAIVILGAAVWPGGAASPALARRIGYGLEAAGRWPDAPIFCSGGVGDHPPSEAAVMAAHLGRCGIASERIVLDEDSRDTLENVVAAATFMRRSGLSRAVVCTDAYHVPRARMIFGQLGLEAEAGPVMPAGRGMAPGEWRRMVARERLAYPYDFAVTWLRRRELLEATKRT